jgi:hypothetical protein
MLGLNALKSWKLNKRAMVLPFVLACLHSGAALAETDPPAAPEAADKPMSIAPSTDSFRFSLGIGALFMRGGNDIVTAVADNGYVRVTQEDSQKLGFWFAAHTFPWSLNGGNTAKAGPGVAVQLGGNDNKVVNSFALIISATSYSKEASVAPLVFSLGYGITTRHSLSDPYQDGAPLPAGSSQPTLKTRSGRGPVVLVSYRFGGN